MTEHARRRPWGRRAVAPALECLEGRRLLSTYTGPSTVRTVLSSGGKFLIQVSGPGVIKENSAGRSGHRPECVRNHECDDHHASHRSARAGIFPASISDSTT